MVTLSGEPETVKAGRPGLCQCKGPVGPHSMSGRAARGTVREARHGAAEPLAPALGFGSHRGTFALRGLALLRAGRCT